MKFKENFFFFFSFFFCAYPASANASGACSGCTLLFLYDVIPLPSLVSPVKEKIAALLYLKK